jgi:paraquat-inducible protein B
MASKEKSMGRKANPAVIGAFVVGAIALAVIGIVVFGSGQIFKNTSKYVCFFSGAVDGLNVGAPVKFKGVEIGSVTDIRLRLPEQPPQEAVGEAIRIPVTIEIDNDRVKAIGGQERRDIKKLVDRGLRAQLNAQSLVTGLLFVQLRFDPDVPAVFVLPPDSKIPEIPTAPTTMEQVQSAAETLFHKLEEVHVEKLVASLTETVDTVKGLVATPELKQTLQALPPTVANVNQAVTSLRELVVRIDAKQAPLFDSLKGTSDKAGATLEQARATLQTVQTVADPGSPLATQLSAALQEITGASRSVRLLADYLERNPSSIVRGRSVETK